MAGKASITTRPWFLGVVVVALVLGGFGLWWSAPGSANFPRRSSEPEEPKAPSAKAVVPETEHDFGIVHPSSTIEHVFVIHSEGEAPLELHRGETSCTCTMSSFDEMVIPPGSAARVTVGMKAKGKKDGPFAESALVLTNDPENEVIQLRITGRILRRIAASPEQLLLGSKVRGELRTVSTTVYSQVWEDFEITEVHPTDPEFRWEISEAEPEALEELGAKSGYELVVHVPGKESSGAFRESLRLQVQPAGKSESTSLSVGIGGDVAGRFTVFGPTFNTYARCLPIGLTPSGKEKSGVLTLKLRDPERPVKIVDIHREPGFLEVDVQPFKPDKPELGLYRIEVRVPKDAPQCDYMTAGRQGQVRIETDHPDVREVEFSVSFAVAR